MVSLSFFIFCSLEEEKKCLAMMIAMGTLVFTLDAYHPELVPETLNAFSTDTEGNWNIESVSISVHEWIFWIQCVWGYMRIWIRFLFHLSSWISEVLFCYCAINTRCYDSCIVSMGGNVVENRFSGECLFLTWMMLLKVSGIMPKPGGVWWMGGLWWKILARCIGAPRRFCV